ncbi:MAG: hypothetical protein AAFO07_27635 [Bacteroidota bacterium]
MNRLLQIYTSPIKLSLIFLFFTACSGDFDAPLKKVPDYNGNRVQVLSLDQLKNYALSGGPFVDYGDVRVGLDALDVFAGINFGKKVVYVQDETSASENIPLWIFDMDAKQWESWLKARQEENIRRSTFGKYTVYQYEGLFFSTYKNKLWLSSVQRTVERYLEQVDQSQDHWMSFERQQYDEMATHQVFLYNKKNQKLYLNVGNNNQLTGFEANYRPSRFKLGLPLNQLPDFLDWIDIQDIEAPKPDRLWTSHLLEQLKPTIIHAKSAQLTENIGFVMLVFEEQSDAIYDFEAQLEEMGLSLNVAYQMYQIKRVITENAVQAFGIDLPLLRNPYVVQIDNQLVFCTHRSALELWIDYLLGQKTIANSETWMDYFEKVNDQTDRLLIWQNNFQDKADNWFADFQKQAQNGLIQWQKDGSILAKKSTEKEAANSYFPVVSWRSDPGFPQKSSISWIRFEGEQPLLLVQDPTTELHAYDLAGKEVWSIPLGKEIIGNAAAVLTEEGNRRIVLNTPSTIFVLSEDGEAIQNIPLPQNASTTVSTNFSGSINDPLWFVTAEDQVLGYDRNGMLLSNWNPLVTLINLKTSPKLWTSNTKDFLWAIDQADNLRFWDLEGTELGLIEKVRTVIDTDLNRLLFLSQDGRLYAFNGDQYAPFINVDQVRQAAYIGNSLCVLTDKKLQLWDARNQVQTTEYNLTSTNNKLLKVENYFIVINEEQEKIIRWSPALDQPEVYDWPVKSTADLIQVGDLLYCVYFEQWRINVISL